MLSLVGLVLTYILYRRWTENERRKQEEAERKKEVEEYKKYCARFGDPFTANSLHSRPFPHAAIIKYTLLIKRKTPY